MLCACLQLSPALFLPSVVPKIGASAWHPDTWNISDSGEQGWLEIREGAEGNRGKLCNSVMRKAWKVEYLEALMEKSLIFDYV